MNILMELHQLMWERETVQLCGRQADQIKDEVELISINSSCFGWRWIPPTLETMMDKKLLFKVNVKFSNIRQYTHIYTVMKICDDKKIVKDESPKENSKLRLCCMYFITFSDAYLKENVCSDSIDMSAVVTNMHNDTDSILTLNGLEECVTNLNEKIPAKRALMG
ncbi:hypothetical protein Ahy_A09g042405 [Arachis hypogaea]|uniref:Uncharacterized protein n=1 Tax=Arachis hypogaea TaxID=3818 RepID=A0A445BFU4_ARAHY|nr:hypothetical protein Ahy_A09g042405 [Arachis hypogaea]